MTQSESLAEIAAALDGLTVNAGGYSQGFTYLPWPRHLNLDEWPATGGVVSVNLASGTWRNMNIGSGATHIRPLYEIVFRYQDVPEITDPDAHRRAISEAMTAAIRGIERPSAGTGAQYVQILNENDTSFVDANKYGETAFMEYRYLVQSWHTVLY